MKSNFLQIAKKIALAQINLIVGDIVGNGEKILHAWEKANADGAELVVFPELCMVGYPPEDLVLTPAFRKAAMSQVHEIARKTASGAALIVGCVWELEGKIYNAALLLDGGRIIHIQPKTKLPNYGIFDEKRLFTAGDGATVISWRGHKIGILVCEDIWHIELAEELGKQGVEAVFAINASPFEVGKYEQRLQVVKDAAIAADAPVYYANMVGGQDDIVFDGGSLVVDLAGEVTSFPQFEEIVALASYHPPSAIHYPPEWQVWNALKLGLADYVRKNGFSSVMLGLSGGIDSAVTAAIAVDALGAKKVLGVLMPSPYSSEHSVKDALKSAKLLGFDTKTIAIDDQMCSFSALLSPEFAQINWMENPAIGGNLQARLRGVILMALSNNFGHLLLSTGNKSEIAVGYSTLYGDSCGAYNPLKDLYKTKVYELAKWRNSVSAAIPKNSIDKPPSAELKPNQRDDDQLPPYDILDAILENHIEKRLSSEEIIALGFAPEVVKKVLHLVRISEYKRRQSCPGVKISPMFFGKDRRFPLTNKF